MNLQEEMNLDASSNEAPKQKTVSFYINAAIYRLSGQWTWTFAGDVLYCSNVIMSYPDALPPGMKGLLHPDDRSPVLQALGQLWAQEVAEAHFSFRIITTYGEVKNIEGAGVRLQPAEDEVSTGNEWLEKEWQAKEAEKALYEGALRSETYSFAERTGMWGSWYFNVQKHHAWYSDNVFRLHGLPPQGLNAHLYTFFPFVHPDDIGPVQDSFDRAFRERLPLHLQFRIIGADNRLRWLYMMTQWGYSSKGEEVLSGVLKDLSEQVSLEQRLEEVEWEVQFGQQLVGLDEKLSQVGHWYVNLLTRKVYFSESCFSIYGIRTKPVVSGLDSFISLVHPEDVARVAEAFKRVYEEGVLPEISYRIIRGDGKTRFVRQQGRALSRGNEVVVVGILQDLTPTALLERKLSEMKEALALQNLVKLETESNSSTGSWLWDLQTDQVRWSDGFYQLLGYKPQSVELTQKHLLRLVHAEDRDRFAAVLLQVTEEGSSADIRFRMLCGGELCLMRGTFRVVHYDEKNFLIGTLQNITSEQVMRRQLQERIQLSELITENILDRAVITDTNNTILLWNRQCEETYKIKKEAAIGRNIFDVLPALKNEENIGLFNRALDGEVIRKPHEKAALHHGYHDLHMLPLRSEKGAVFGVLHILHDVTGEQMLQQRLNDRLSFIEGLLEATVDRIIALDRNMNYLYWNRRAEQYYGIPKKEVIGKNILEIFPSFISDPSYDELRRALKGETVHIPAAKGSDKGNGYAESYLIPIIGSRGEVDSVLWIVHDLSRDQQLMDELKKSDELLNNINEAYMELDAELKVIYINAQCEQLWNKTKEEVVGRPLLDIFPQLEGSGSYTAVRNAIDSHQPVKGEFLSPVLGRWIFMSCTPHGSGAIVLFYDVQELREAELKLQEEHKRLKESQALGHIGSYVRNLEDDSVAWSDELYRIHGLEPQSMVLTKEHVLSFVHPEDRETFTQALEALGSRGETMDLVNRIIRADGELRYVHRRGELIYNEKGEPVKIGGTILDVTEIWLSKLRLEQSEAMLRVAEEVALVGSYEVRLADMKIHFSDGMYRLFGELPGSFEPGLEFIDSRSHPDDIAPVREVLERAALDKQPYHYLRRIYHADGSQRFLEAHGKVICNEAGEATHFMGMVQDITERRNAEEALQLSRAFAEQVAGITPDMITIHDAVTNRVIYANRDALWSDKYSNEEIYGADDSLRMGMLISEEDQQKAREFLEKRRLLGDHETLEVELRLAHSDPGRKWIRIRSKVFSRDEQGKAQQIISFTTNTSESRQVLEELEKAHQQLYQIFECVPEHMAYCRSVYNRDGEVVDFILEESNESSLRQLNQRREVAIGRKLSEILPNVAVHPFFWSMIQVATTGEAVREEVLNPLGGKMSWSLLHAIPFAEGLLVAGLDITDRKQVEGELKDSRDLLEQTAEATPDVIMIYDLARSQPIYLNRVMEKWTGYSNEELVSMGMAGRVALLHPDDREALIAFNARVMEGGEHDVLTIEYRFRKKDGDWLWIRNRSKVFRRNAGGEAAYLLSVLVDVTEEITLQEQLRERSRLVEAVIESSVDRMMVVAADHTIITWNRQCEEMYGLPKERVIGADLFRIFPKLENDWIVRDAYERSFGGESVQIPRRKDVYTSHYTEFFYVPLKGAGEVVYAVLVIGHDVTESVLAEEELKELNRTLEKKNRELEQKNEEISHFAFVASHDLKEPLRKIHTFSDWIVDKESDHLSATSKNYLGKIKASVKRVEQLISDILELTKIHSEKHRMVDVDLGEVLATALSELSAQVEEKEAQVHYELLPHIKGRKSQLVQLFSNLLSNALKFQLPGNQPLIRIGAEVLPAGSMSDTEADPQRSYLKVSFADNGLGFDSKYVKKVFTVFQRLHSRPDLTGTGMGLAICRKVMENHQGFIRVETDEGKGSVFSCYFPFDK